MKLISPEYRILTATVILIYCMAVTFLDGLKWFTINDTIIITLIGFASTLLGLGIVKQHKSFRDVSDN